MKVSDEHLLYRLKRLYSQLFLSMMHLRMDEYHAESEFSNLSRLNKSLHDFIDGIITEVSDVPSSLDVLDIRTLDAKLFRRINEFRDDNAYVEASVALEENDWCEHLHKSNWKWMHDDLKSKLQHNCLDHIYSAQRFARCRDTTISKLHADLAIQALKTLSCYMHHDDYQIFVDEISLLVSDLHVLPERE